MELHPVEINTGGKERIEARFGSGQRRLIAQTGGRKWVTLYDPHLGNTLRILKTSWAQVRARVRPDHEVSWPAICEIVGNHELKRPLTALEARILNWACGKAREG